MRGGEKGFMQCVVGKNVTSWCNFLGSFIKNKKKKKKKKEKKFLDRINGVTIRTGVYSERFVAVVNSNFPKFCAITASF